MKYLKLFYLSVLMSLALACSDDDSGDNNEAEPNESNEISNEPFSGTINQVPFESKYAFGFLQLDGNEETELKFYVSENEFDCNDDFNKISYDVRGTVLIDQLGFQVTTIATDTDNGIANQTGELIDLVSIDGEEAVVKVRTSGNEYTLEGKFTVTICPNLEIKETN